MANTNSTHPHSHKMHIYSPRKQPKQYGFKFNNNNKKKKKKEEQKEEDKLDSYQPSIILHPFGDDPNENDILISSSGATEIKPPKEENPNKLKSSSTLKKPTKNKNKNKKQTKQKLYSRSNSKKKLNLKPSDSDTTNISTSFKQSYHQKQRIIKKMNRKFGMDKHNRVTSFTPNDNDLISIPPSSPSSPNSPSFGPSSPSSSLLIASSPIQIPSSQTQLPQKSMSVSPKGFTKRITPVYATNYSDSNMKIKQNNHIKTIHDKNGRKTSIRRFTNNHRRQRSKFEPVAESKIETKNDDENKEKEEEKQRTSASFTTDDIEDIPKYKKSHRVLCRPSGDKDEKWRPGTIQEIMEIDNKEYLSIMAEVDDTLKNNNDDSLPTFAQYYIPSIDKTRVRPLYHKEHKIAQHKDDKNESNDNNKTKIMITEHGKDGNNTSNRSSGKAKQRLRLKNTRSNPSYTNSTFAAMGIGGDFNDYDINHVDIKNNDKLYYKNDLIETPNIINKPLNDWSSLEVSAWLLSIENAKYSIYTSAMIENNVNGKALYQLKFVTMMKLTRYQINVNDCTHLLKAIKSLIKSVLFHFPFCPFLCN